jgi:uncharacterized membrane protein YbhN (UPF0104 family)
MRVPRRVVRLLGPLLGTALLVVAIVVLRRELSHTTLRDVGHELRSLSHQVPTPALLGALLAYRVIYYLLPLMVAALFLGVREALRLVKTHDWLR